MAATPPDPAILRRKRTSASPGEWLPIPRPGAVIWGGGRAPTWLGEASMIVGGGRRGGEGRAGCKSPFWGIGESSVLQRRSYFCVKIARQVQVLARVKVCFRDVRGHDTWYNGQLDIRACEWAWPRGEEGREMGVRTLWEGNVSAHRVSLCRDTHPPVTLASPPLPLNTAFFLAVCSLFSPFYQQFHFLFKLTPRYLLFIYCNASL